MLENFTRLLSSLLAAGVPLSRALVILCKETAAPAAAVKWKEIHDLVVDGMSLADAMAKSPDTFRACMSRWWKRVKPGASWTWCWRRSRTFKRAKRNALQSHVRHALSLCPAVPGAKCSDYLMVFFIPRFQLIFADFHANLPLLTQVIVKTSEVLRSYGLFAALALGIAGFLVRNWFVSPAGRRAWEGLILRIPTLGSLVRSTPCRVSRGCWARCWARVCR